MALPLPVTLSLPVSTLYGGLNALVVIALGMAVTRLRIQTKAIVGSPQPKELTVPVRAHGNAAEWVPLGLVLLLVLELSSNASRFNLHLTGGSFFLARVLHALGLHSKTPALGIAGALLNYLVLTVMAVWLLNIRFSG
jgi:uncharacterized membrane protein YecN with MAPEG domain